MKFGIRRLLLGVLLGVLLYGAAVAYSGYQRVHLALDSFHWSAFAAAICLASLNYCLRFWKWQYYLRRLGVTGVPAGESALVFLSGFVLTITPGKLGEVFKSAVLARTHGVPAERTAPIIVAERLTDVIAIVIWVVVGSTGFHGGSYWAAAGTLAVALGLLCILWEPPVRLLIRRIEQGRWARFAPKLASAHASLRVVASPSALAWPVLLSLIGWGLEGVGLHALLAGFGHAPALSFSMFFYATATLAGALVPVPGGLGVTEAIIHQQLVSIAGAPEPVAAASMILIRLATLWWAVLVGFCALGWLRMRFPVQLSSAGESGDIAAVPTSSGSDPSKTTLGSSGLL
jgi:uncharacterized protein (TIRG00374 family)